MAFARPTLSELVTRIEQDFISRLALVGAVLRRSVVAVLSRVMAGATHMLHGHLDYLSKQLFADTSDREYLLRQAGLYGITPIPATFAETTVEFTGADGELIPADSVLLRSDGAEYYVLEEVTISFSSGSGFVVSALAGAAYSLAAGTALTFQSPVSGVDATAFVATVLQDGTDEESTEALRTRFLERLQNPPHGGAEADYIAWAKTIAGVTRVWVSPSELGAGTVVVRFVRDEDASIIPDAGEVAEVQDYIDTVRPVTAAVSVFAPVAVPLNFTLSVTPDTTAVRDAVEAELEDMLLDASPGGTVLLSEIRTAIGIAAELTDYTLTSPAADVTHAAGELATLGVITWT